MKLYFVKEESLTTLKAGLHSIVTRFTGDSSDWMEEVLGTSPFMETKFPEIPDFTLDMSEDPANAFRTDAKNAELVYSNLAFLSDSQASDERLWAALCLREFWPYVQYRWRIKEKCTERNIEQHFFYGYDTRRSLTRNAMARLWWIGRLSIDRDSKDDPYRLTRFVCENADNIMHTMERNTSNSSMITRAFLSAALDAREREHLTMNTDVIGELAKYLNLLGGTYILDCLPEQVIYNKIMEKAREIHERKCREVLEKEEMKQKLKQLTGEE